MMPDFGGINTVPAAGLTGLKQEINARPCGSSRPGMPPGFGIVTAFGMRHEAEGPDDLSRIHTVRLGRHRAGRKSDPAVTLPWPPL